MVKLIPQVDRDGLPEKDPLGRPNERIGVRKFVLAPGASICFQRPDDLFRVPGSGNLTTFNPLVSQYHAWLTAGPSNTVSQEPLAGMSKFKELLTAAFAEHLAHGS